MMKDRDLYQKKKQAQLDEWNAEIAKLKAKASIASADAQLQMNKQIRAIESQFEENRTKLAEFAKAGEDAWESLKAGMEDAWASLKTGVHDAAAKFK